MNLNELLGAYIRSENTQKLLQQLDIPNANIIQAKGLINAAQSMQLIALALTKPSVYICICTSKEEALYLFTDIDNIIKCKGTTQVDTLKCFYFPDSYTVCGDFSSEQNTQQILERTELLTHLSKNIKHLDNFQNTASTIIISYPEALLEKVITQASLQSKTLHIKKGELFDIDFAIELLVDLNFEATDFVQEPGQFSIRGGIIDIFSFGNEVPYRIELFGKEVESIRTFDTLTQLTIQNIAFVTIIPNTNMVSDGHITTLFFDFVAQDAIIWMHNGIDVFQSLDSYKPLLQEYAGSGLFISNINEINAYLEKNRIIEVGTRNYYDANYVIDYEIKAQPSFNKNFNLLIENLIYHKSIGYTNIICADNAKQIERFYNIFDDISPVGKSQKRVNTTGVYAAPQGSTYFQPIPIALHQGFIDTNLKILVYTDHQIFQRFHKYKQKAIYSKTNAISLKSLTELKPGDFVVHIDHGIGKYSGLQKLEINGIVQEVVRIYYKDNDTLYVNINSLHKITKYAGKEGSEPKINKLGSDAWEQLKRKTKVKVKEIAFDLIKLYAQRKATSGFAFSPDTYLQTELEASFIYEDTPDQYKATQDVKADMEKPHPMDRLVCGDVGFGKTEVAVRAAFKAVTDSKQVAVLVPTTILAMQHAKTFMDRLSDFPCNIEFVNRFKTAKQQKEIFQKLAEGKIDILIGTHILLSSKVKFKNLGLMIIDEEQKFGVAAKDKLKLIKTTVDTLTLTATPIPRTLQFSMMGARDLSIINTPPPNRQPVNTAIITFDVEKIKQAIEFEVYRGGQVYFINNRVNDIGEVAALIKKLCPDFEIGVAHGQLDGETLEERMLNFIERKYDVLVCTNIVESGLDISNANTIIINHAHHHGLSDLHQLRGRVGRNNKKAYCYLVAPPLHVLTPDSRRRLQTIEQFSDLGSGFNISLRDLDIRGAGNLLGGEQSGFVAEIGFEMYHKILDEAINELKETEFKDLFEEVRTDSFKTKFVKDCSIDADTEMMLPDEYVSSISERLNLYRQLDNVENESQLQAFEIALKDRFGHKIPEAVSELFEAVRLRWLATALGFEKIQIRNTEMKCFFVADANNKFYESARFQKIMQFVNDNANRCVLKQTEKSLILTIKHIKSINSAKEFLSKM